jgi:uncharacterized membrane protein
LEVDLIAVLAHQIGSIGATPLAAQGLGPWWRFTGVFHPAVVHFPIALLILAAAVESWNIVRRKRKPLHTTLVCLYFGAAAAVVATLLGWANADANAQHGTIVTIHRWLGVAVAVLAVAAAVISIFVTRREIPGPKLLWSYRASILAAGGLVGLVGMYGGMISFGKDHYSDAYAQLQRELNDSANGAAQAVVATAQDVARATADGAAKVAEKVASPVVQTVASATPAPAAPSSPTPSPTPTPTPSPPPTTTSAVPTTLPSVSPVAIAPVAPAVAAVAAAESAVGGGHLDYARDIEPIFTSNCVKCHNESKKKGGYRLDAKDHVFAAGESGNVPIVPGKADESRLVKMIEGKGEFADSVMPPKGDPLTYQQIQLIRQWIDDGAKTSTP